MMHFMQHSVRYVAEKGCEERICYVADPYGCFRQTDDTGRSDRADGGTWKRRVHCPHQKRY